jgi:transmembrane sensor
MMDQSRFAAAGEWLLRLQDDDLDPEEFAAWLHWYEADPLNRVAFEEMQSAFESANSLAADDRSEWARELIHDTREPAAAPAGKARFIQARYAIAASVVAVAAGAFAWQAWFDDEPSQTITTTLQTPRATHRIEKLPDGSTVQLGARSSISLSFSRDARYLVLESGEAFFSVAKDAARPFVVQAGSVAVHAVGTEFNVRRDGETTIVSVREGKVDIVKGVLNAGASPGAPHAPTSPVRLSAGEQVAARDPESGLSIKTISPQAIAAWQKGRLEFADEPLRQVIATVNRYSSREIVLTDQSLGALRITGTVGEDRINEWTRALPAIFPVRIVEVSNETVLISPAATR